MMFLPVVALLLTAVAADEPAWRIEITTSGGLTGLGAGRLAIAADGTLLPRPDCGVRLTAEDLKAVGELVRKAKPREWKPSYIRSTNPYGCCDMIKMTLTLTRGGSRWTSTWFDDHLPLPADLDAIVSALWAPTTSIRSRYLLTADPRSPCESSSSRR
jgi:hypothetical protein